MMNAEETDAKALELLEEATQAEAGTLTHELVLRELGGWDSMGMVMFIGLVQRQLSVKLSVHDLHESRTVADLVTLVRERSS